jgi:hypothetical protein
MKTLFFTEVEDEDEELFLAIGSLMAEPLAELSLLSFHRLAAPLRPDSALSS